MNIQDFLQKGYTIKDIRQTSGDEIIIQLENTKIKLILVAANACCDSNWFNVSHRKPLSSLVGRNLINVYEEPDDIYELIKSDSEYESDSENNASEQAFYVIIMTSYNKILTELRNDNKYWKSLPKDIYNLFLTQYLADERFRLIRRNSSNGYYSGYLELYLKD